MSLNSKPMPYEVKLNQRTAVVELLIRQGEKVLISVDGKEYNLDIEKVGEGKLSILYQHQSFNVELIQGQTPKQFHVNTKTKAYDVDIIDAEAKYLANRKRGQEEEGDDTILAPIPGKVVKVMVENGETVSAGQTLIVLSAMKMESEFKARRDGKVVDIRVEAGQTVEARQAMLVMEYIREQE